MIGKPQWFKPRKYSGWGIFPKTWQGWAYMAAVILPMFVIQALPFWSEKTRLILLFVWAATVFIDVFDIMIRMPRDEREKIHEAIAERNALWFIVIILAVGVAYRAAAGVVMNKIDIDPVIIAALFGGLAVKAITNIYLDRKN